MAELLCPCEQRRRTDEPSARHVIALTAMPLASSGGGQTSHQRGMWSLLPPCHWRAAAADRWAISEACDRFDRHATGEQRRRTDEPSVKYLIALTAMLLGAPNQQTFLTDLFYTNLYVRIFAIKLWIIYKKE